MLDSQQIQTLKTIIRSLVAQCDVTFKVPPFDRDLYQECVDELASRGYPMEGKPSVQTYLWDTFAFATLPYGHTDRDTQKWIALYTVGAYYVDDASVRFPDAIPRISTFNERFVEKQQQADRMLDIFADYLRQASSHFHPVPAQLIITSNMNFVNGCLLEYETRLAQPYVTSKLYPDYVRERNTAGEACAYYAFPRKVPLKDYFQVIPDVMVWMNTVNDVLSFYKEELVGDCNNQASILANQSKKSKLEVLEEMARRCVCLYKGINKTLEESPEALEAFRRFTDGYTSYHLSSKRYSLADLDLF